MVQCLECGGKQTCHQVAKYHYTECGLPGVHLHGVRQWTCAECGSQETEVPHIEGLHKALAEYLAEKNSRLLPTEFRYLRQYLGFSGRDLAKHFGVTPETVSRWENGKRPISIASERLIRLMARFGHRKEDYAYELLMSSAKTTRPRRTRTELCLTGDSWEECGAQA